MVLTLSSRDGSRGKERSWAGRRGLAHSWSAHMLLPLFPLGLSNQVWVWQRVSSQAKKRPLLMVMSCHGEFSFCWDRSCGALPPRSPATERLLSTESYLASAQRVCWIRKLMRVPRGLVSGKPLSLHSRPTRGLPSWTAVPHLHLSKGKNKPVFDKNRIHLEALHKALQSVLDWQSEADS